VAKKTDLEEILATLGSDKARRQAISQLVRKVKLSPPQIEEAIEFYEQAGNFRVAADVALEAGMKERAVEVYEKAGRFEDASWFVAAAKAALKAGMTERAEQLRTLVKLINE